MNSVHFNINNRHQIDYSDPVAVDTAITEGLELCHQHKDNQEVSDYDYNILANNVQYYMYKRALNELTTTASTGEGIAVTTGNVGE